MTYTKTQQQNKSLKDSEELQRIKDKSEYLSISDLKRLDEDDMLQKNHITSFYSDDDELISNIKDFENVYIYSEIPKDSHFLSCNKYLIVLDERQ